MAQDPVDHAFRHEYGRLVATLVRRFGPGELSLIEDCVQSALAAAVTAWPRDGTPNNPGAWLQTVARNRLLDALRSRGRSERADEGAEPEAKAPAPDGHYASEIDDDELRMLFVCCDDAIPVASQLVLALKTLCGFSTRELALRLLTREDTVQKRLGRARQKLRERWDDREAALQTPDDAELRERLPAVQQVLYLLFNEGYSSALDAQPIRRELCDEALRLTQRLVTHPAGDTPASWALLALMWMHRARLDARTDAGGGLLMLEEQDRSRWDRAMIAEGLACLQKSASGEEFTRYHAEAGVLAEHCMAPSYADTRWDEIASLYETLERLQPSVLHTLNRAIAVAEWQGPEAGLAMLQALTPPAWLTRYYLWDATLGELHRRSGDRDAAERYLRRAIERAPTAAERAVLARRLET